MKNIKLLTALFFLVTSIEVIAEYYRYYPVIYVFKPLISIVLMVLYTIHSSNRSLFFYIVIFTSMLTNIFFISTDMKWLYCGLIIFVCHRIVKMYYIVRLVHIKDFAPVLIASVPFLAIFFYIFYQADLFDSKMYGIISLHNILISLLGGLALSNYVMNDNNKSSWLLITVLSFATLHFIIFIEKFYIELKMFRPMAMSLNAFAYFAFYKFVMAIENGNQNEA